MASDLPTISSASQFVNVAITLTAAATTLLEFHPPASLHFCRLSVLLDSSTVIFRLSVLLDSCTVLPRV
jgi:hypothetical protein